jgi:hypothetical protein
MNREIRLSDIFGNYVFHAEEIGPDNWRWTTPEMSGMISGNWEALIASIDNMIGGLDYGSLYYHGHVYSDHAELYFDKNRRNQWIDGEYLAPNQYLIKVIPRQKLEEQ